jgi:long-chain acyl-CoA synthetase
MPQSEIDLLESDGHINTITQLLKFIEKYSDKTAICINESEKTYRELLDDVAKTRSYLIKNQIHKGDIVGIQMDNEYLFVVMFLAVTTIGAVAEIFPNQMPINLVQMIYKYHQLKLLIYSNRLSSIYDNFPFKTVCANNATNNQSAPPIEVKPEDLAALYFTSGTIAKPKSVMLTHKNLMRGMTNGAYGFSKILFVKYLTVIPFFHVFGLVRNLLTLLYTGSANYLCNDFKNFLPDLQKVNPDIVCVTPAMLEMICHFGKQDIKLLGNHLKTIVVGGATVSPILLEQANTLGIYTCQGYGLTETANLVCGNRFPNKNPNSVGEIFNFQEIKLVAKEL